MEISAQSHNNIAFLKIKTHHVQNPQRKRTEKKKRESIGKSVIYSMSHNVYYTTLSIIALSETFYILYLDTL